MVAELVSGTTSAAMAGVDQPRLVVFIVFVSVGGDDGLGAVLSVSGDPRLKGSMGAQHVRLPSRTETVAGRDSGYIVNYLSGLLRRAHHHISHGFQVCSEVCFR
ncbi:MAG: hypothetical protein IJH84_09790 [Saccharopolyspora sp.]|nr:hypothetical protein [Saccharopolyspora sp.]MBQ6641311.1 hypothetical protein [Saccharopolyspora sp.]